MDFLLVTISPVAAIPGASSSSLFPTLIFCCFNFIWAGKTKPKSSSTTEFGLIFHTSPSIVPNSWKGKVVGEAKALVRSLGANIDDKVIEQTIQQLADIWDGEEARHGIESFLNKTNISIKYFNF